MAERHQSGIADQDIEPERENGIEQNLARDVDVIDFTDRKRHGDKGENGGTKGESDGKAAASAAMANEICPPTGP